MRILIANDGFGDAGGVQSYLDAVVPALRARGHATAVLHCDLQPAARATGALGGVDEISVARSGLDGAAVQVSRWQPDVVYSHNMSRLDVERRLMDAAPVVKFMHGYFGTCIGGQKMFGMPSAAPCSRRFGAACLLFYGPRRCGPLDLTTFAHQYGWAHDQQALFNGYHAVVVASDHMRREYVAHGINGDRVHVNPLFPTHQEQPEAATAPQRSVVFFGRMTNLKGGDLLIEAVGDASRRLGSAIALTMVGDGPQRAAWEQVAAEHRVDANFVGWRTGAERWAFMRGAALVAVPSVWPEPFGLVGLEAGALGVPAIAFDVGGIREWLTPGENGILVPGDPPRAANLASALADAFGRPDDLARMGAAAIRVARRLSLAAHVDRLEAVLAPAAEVCAHSAGR